MNKEQVTAALEAQISASLTLVVGQSTKDGIGTRRVRLGKGADTFREQAQDTAARIAAGSPTPYTASAELDDGAYFLLDDQASLDELAQLHALVRDIGDIEPVSPRDLDSGIRLYAVGLGEGHDQVALIRRTDPRLAVKSGRFLAVARERLERVDEPVFTFSSDFDLVIASDWAVVLNQAAFERLARGTGIIERHVKTWITGITTHLPMDELSLGLLQQTALRDSRTWRRLRDIQRRGHLATVTIEQVTAYAKSVDLDPADIVRDGILHFDPSKRFGFLHLLSEDLYTGALTGERFESQRKASMD